MLLAMNIAQQSRKPTRLEVAGYAILDSTQLAYERQKPFAGKFTPDATVEDARLVVQFDGDYWHDKRGISTEARILRRVALDRSQDAYIRACGWEVVRVWESEVRADPQACTERIIRIAHRLEPTDPTPKPTQLGSGLFAGEGPA